MIEKKRIATRHTPDIALIQSNTWRVIRYKGETAVGLRSFILEMLWDVDTCILIYETEKRHRLPYKLLYVLGFIFNLLTAALIPFILLFYFLNLYRKGLHNYITGNLHIHNSSLFVTTTFILLIATIIYLLCTR